MEMTRWNKTWRLYSALFRGCTAWKRCSNSGAQKCSEKCC